ncbi:DUF6527 family protein [Pedobacter cryophilus]|uniref:DUF6527 family protein n=1 Tax=Pedobacter cryophilus TaxID=2571271 RepID=UPI00197D7A4F|nr:DUF6527 family protein [Pedobacter cryophilus]
MKTLKPNFVEFIPDVIGDDTLYISMKYKTVRHKCVCGCGNIVITPITPNDWWLKYNGAGVTLKPSIGNWGFSCRSHYWIINSAVIWAEEWSDKEVKIKREKDFNRKKTYYKDIKAKKNAKDGRFFVFFKKLYATRFKSIIQKILHQNLIIKKLGGKYGNI